MYDLYDYFKIIVGTLLLGWFLFHFLLWIFVFIISETINIHKEYTTTNKFYNWVFVLWYRYMMIAARLRIHVTGAEKVPLDQKFLLVSNHRSKFDNFVQCAVLKKNQLAYVSKPENFKIPMGGRFMRRGLYLSIARGNPREGLKTILKASEYIKGDLVSIGIFPEGARTRDGNLMEFKPGSFKIAEKASCPTVVCCMQGTENISSNWPWKKTDIYMDILDVIQPDVWKEKTTVDVADYAHDLIQKKIAESQEINK
ncbi:MAG: 1-acyl-sn-glycerol-3-phosphate acyltransferase [Treponema sp.]|nr:1-acyl-sn-glycerol-3-phosphate acyltransferase [Treponema sp.]